MEQYEKLKLHLEERLILISKENASLSKQVAASIHACMDVLGKLKNLINKNPFQSVKEEILFFKYIKPEISSKLIYYIQLYSIISKKPSGTDKRLKKYYNNHLKTINQFMDANISFYQYYRSESIHLDESYFTRSETNLHLILDFHSFNYDPNFNTSHDHKVATIIAFDQLTIYLHSEINKIEKNLFSQLPINPILPEPALKWTDNKNALIELIYALQATGSFNNGKADVKEIATFFETTLKIELGDLYRNFHELRYRKSNRTKYIDTLKTKLINRMDTNDEK